MRYLMSLEELDHQVSDGSILLGPVPLMLCGVSWQCSADPSARTSIRDDQHARPLQPVLPEEVHQERCEEDRVKVRM